MIADKPDEDVEYFRDDSGGLVASVGVWGGIAMFLLRAGDREWEFLVRESPRWDSIHQGIYRNMHDYNRVKPSELPDLPPMRLKGAMVLRWIGDETGSLVALLSPLFLARLRLMAMTS